MNITLFKCIYSFYRKRIKLVNCLAFISSDSFSVSSWAYFVSLIQIEKHTGTKFWGRGRGLAFLIFLTGIWIISKKFLPELTYVWEKNGLSALPEGSVNTARCFCASVFPSLTAFSQDWLIAFSEFLHEARVSTEK